MPVRRANWPLLFVIDDLAIVGLPDHVLREPDSAASGVTGVAVAGEARSTGTPGTVDEHRTAIALSDRQESTAEGNHHILRPYQDGQSRSSMLGCDRLPSERGM
jgi:hypothetical protein